MGSVLKTPLNPLHPVCHRHQHGSGTKPYLILLVAKLETYETQQRHNASEIKTSAFESIGHSLIRKIDLRVI
jgi:hypothetical protein